jgi:predicted AlkP superfamily phosphohydrolase/phosphomutase
MIKLLIIGLDGATFRVLKPLCNEGRLPNLKHLITKGVQGVLESTFPPLTGPAWTALATGKNPGKTGVFDFLNRVSKHSFKTKVLSSSEIRRAVPYWDYLSCAGIKVGIINFPLLYPPYKINGIMVSGVGSDPKDNISYPREFKQKLVKICQNYRIHIPWNESQYSGRPSYFIKDIFELLEVNHKTLQFLLNQDLDVVTFVISATDFTQHYMWRYWDSTHPYYQKEDAEKYKPAFIQIWRKVDEILDFAVKVVYQQANVFIVSDHGFGPHRSSFHTNSWLQMEGYIMKRNTFLKLGRLQEMVAKLIKKLSKDFYDKLLTAVNAGKLPRIPADAGINMEKSLAFALVGTSVGGIYLNKPSILSNEGYSDSNFLKYEIIEKLKEMCSNLKLPLKVHSPEEVYSGPYTNLAPDILFEIDGFKCDIESSLRLSKNFYQCPPSNANYSGIHTMDGIFIACGPDIIEGSQIKRARIYDVAPTVLHILEQPVPNDVDGRVLKEIFRKDSKPAQREVVLQKVGLEEVRDKIRRLKEAGRL